MDNLNFNELEEVSGGATKTSISGGSTSKFTISYDSTGNVDNDKTIVYGFIREKFSNDKKLRSTGISEPGVDVWGHYIPGSKQGVNHTIYLTFSRFNGGWTVKSV